jgi:prepilin-type N-terminal cleavage/methylation domain-containing protein
MRNGNGIDRSENRIIAGFSLLELLIVVAILTLLAGLTVPNLMRAVHTSRLRGAGTDLAGLLQQARMRAIQDDRFYSVYPNTNNNVLEEFVDIYPQAVNGASGSNGATVDPRDPVITVSSEIVQQPQNAAPSTANLSQQVLGSNPSGLVPVDGSAAGTPVTFGPQGLPCTPVPVSGGTVCNSQGGPVFYWVFFQDNVSQNWEAVTVTPAGHIQKWYYTGTVWGKV